MKKNKTKYRYFLLRSSKGLYRQTWEPKLIVQYWNVYYHKWYHAALTINLEKLHAMSDELTETEAMLITI